MLQDPFVSLELEVVEAMLDLAELKPGERHVELGAGDGRFVEAAVRRGALSIGYEIDPDLAADCRERGLNVVCGDMFKADVSRADVVTFWLIFRVPELLDKLRAEMAPGSRIVLLADQWTGDGIPDHEWLPSCGDERLRNKFWRYDVTED